MEIKSIIRWQTIHIYVIVFLYLGFGWGRIAIRTAVLMVLLLVALLIPKFDKILDLIGGSTISLMSFIFPPIFYMRLASKKVVNNNISEIIPTERPIRYDI